MHVWCCFDGLHISWTTSRHLDYLLTPAECLDQNKAIEGVCYLFTFLYVHCGKVFESCYLPQIQDNCWNPTKISESTSYLFFKFLCTIIHMKSLVMVMSSRSSLKFCWMSENTIELLFRDYRTVCFKYKMSK